MDDRARVRAVRLDERPPDPAHGAAVRRRAASGRHRPGAGRQPARADARRAFPRPGAGGRAAHLRHAAADPGHRAHRVAGGAGRQPGAPGGVASAVPARGSYHPGRQAVGRHAGAGRGRVLRPGHSGARRGGQPLSRRARRGGQPLPRGVRGGGQAPREQGGSGGDRSPRGSESRYGLGQRHHPGNPDRRPLCAVRVRALADVRGHEGRQPGARRPRDHRRVHRGRRHRGHPHPGAVVLRDRGAADGAARLRAAADRASRPRSTAASSPRCWSRSGCPW